MFRDCEGKPRTALYEYDRESSDGDESRAYVCLYESEETGNDDEKAGPHRPPQEETIF